mmetsp:Transcript_75659/g.133554  ORF Transcript_75659/g.133554 Transcript_75659/m.133554 type:complete len:980 (+) Transcript_75659:82-3021(+)|eukprot:CAMPEP_0197625960 /NCGR_PEP_ID=MMETSP1338-20131121/5153_1 /TAXON_ID=43686 ORGANISM="Pelagodinium beii, Strain RCC1491" /NCGR_SAMPLE_ID=MMETSP1338 /ASSEMBLY_ACC=CAM_ASM_000754 /LENGTH=979 /DNA_ID=CAMNT_0043196473 /DNA_START=63 /DNA_END=3002 /DNA_ORIENTATION=+
MALPGKRASIAGVKNLSAEEQLRQRDEKLQECTLWPKINAGELHKITKQDIDEVFNLFDAEGSGEISLEELMEIKKVEGLQLTGSDLKTLCEDADKEQTGMITSMELFRAITQGELAFNMLKKALNPEALREFKPTVCSINELIDYLREDYEITEALWSLPVTGAIFFSFLIAAVFHFSMANAYKISNLASLGALGQYSSGKVNDVPTLINYLQLTWRPQHYFQDLTLYPPGRYYGNNQVLGGFRLRRTYSDPTPVEQSEHLESVYNPFPLFGVRYYKRGSTKVDDQFLLYHELTDLVNERIENISRSFWLDANTSSLSIDTILLNPMMNSLAFEQVSWTFQPDGYVKYSTSHETLMADPYIDLNIAIADVVFTILIFKVLYRELQQAIPAAKAGLDGIMNYLDIWSTVDWLTISFGLLCISMWGIVVMKVYAVPEVFAQFPTAALDEIVLTNQSYMTELEVNIVASHEQLHDVLEDMFAAAEDVASWHGACRYLAVVYMFILMMKFFNAFRANARTNVVIETLTTSAVDVGHFLMVFMAVFACFAWAAHVFIGGAEQGFSYLLRSLFFRWTSGMSVAKLDDLPWMGWIIGYSYTLFYEFLVSNLILGILFALIFEAYGKVQAASGSPPTMVQQVLESVRKMAATSDYVDAYELMIALEDDDEPAHPALVVTVKSLKHAFVSQGMTIENAEYLIEKASEFAEEMFEEPQLEISDNLNVSVQLRTICLKAIHLSESLMEILKQESRKPQEMRYDAIMQGYDPDDPADVEELIRKQALEEQKDMHSMHVPEVRVVSKAQLTRTDTNMTQSEESAEDTWNDDQLREKVDRVLKIGLDCSADQDDSTRQIEEELNLYQHSTRTSEIFFQQELDDLTALFETCEQGVNELVVCFDGSDLQSIQELPERLHHLYKLARESREALTKPSSSNASSSGSDPLKRLELRISELRKKIDELTSTADAQDEMREALSRVKMSIRELSEEY